MDGRISWLRISACYLVILLHVAAVQSVTMTNGWKVAVLIESFTRVSVPIFFMLSGATLLRKTEPLGTFVSKRLLRIVPPLVFWSLIYLAWAALVGTQNMRVPAALSDWAPSILQGPVIFHLWYLYAILGLYAAIPMLRRFYQNATMSEKCWALGLWFVCGSVIPTVNAALTPSVCDNLKVLPKFEATYSLSMFSGYLGYILLGAVIAEVRCKARIGIACFVFGSLATFGAILWQAKMASGPCQMFFIYTTPFVVVAAAGLFSAIQTGVRTEQANYVHTLGACTLGIYCIHYLFIGEIFTKFGIEAVGRQMIITAPVIALAAFVLSGAVIYVMRLSRLGRIVT